MLEPNARQAWEKEIAKNTDPTLQTVLRHLYTTVTQKESRRTHRQFRTHSELSQPKEKE